MSAGADVTPLATSTGRRRERSARSCNPRDEPSPDVKSKPLSLALGNARERVALAAGPSVRECSCRSTAVAVRTRSAAPLSWAKRRSERLLGTGFGHSVRRPSGRRSRCRPPRYDDIRGRRLALGMGACDMIHRVPRAEGLPRPALAFRAVHSVIATSFLFAIGYVWWCALTGRRGSLLRFAIGALLSEGALVIVNRGDCPLRPLQ